MSYLATALLLAAVIHTFSAKRLLALAHRYPNSMLGQALHYLGEVEVVFGLWAAAFVAAVSCSQGLTAGVAYLETINYTEAAFVFVIMCMAATKPVLLFVERIIAAIAGIVPVPRCLALYCTSLTCGPLLGSLITEPAAMTVTALLIKEFLTPATSLRFRYATVGLLFVNISIGGTLTHFAAPPVLMVAGAWQWTTAFMAATFGGRAALAVAIGTLATALIFRRDFAASASARSTPTAARTPFWVTLGHLAFLTLTILTAHHMAFFLPLFIFFLGWCSITAPYQERLRLKESLLVGFFLGGLVTLGKLQEWWLQPVLAQLGDLPLFWGALSLTALTDNAALTYLGTLVPTLTASAKYALVAGAVAGGGLTVIANAPNPAGYGLLRECFGEDGISPLGLFLGALPYTLLAALAFLVGH